MFNLPSLASLFLAFMLSIFFISDFSFGSDPVDSSSEVELTHRVKTISMQIRCLVCKSQSIAESDADLAVSLRQLVYDKLKEGYNDEEVIEYLRERYGDYILLSPPFEFYTLILWFFPLVILLSGGLVIYLRYYRHDGGTFSS